MQPNPPTLMVNEIVQMLDKKRNDHTTESDCVLFYLLFTFTNSFISEKINPLKPFVTIQGYNQTQKGGQIEIPRSAH